MKLVSTITATVAILAPIVHAQKQSGQHFTVSASYDDTLVDVGDLDLFWAVWTRMYDVADDKGGLSDNTRQQFNLNCNPDGSKPKLSTRVELDGQWGAVNGLNGWEMRDALIHSMWKTVQTLAEQQSYPVYTNCLGFTWQESVPGHANAACGRKAKTTCPEDNGNCHSAGGLECQNGATGHKMPSTIRINVYNQDGSLRADEYQVRFSSETPTGGGGCGKAGAIAEVLASFVPGIGTYFEKGIKIACRQGGFK